MIESPVFHFILWPFSVCFTHFLSEHCNDRNSLGWGYKLGDCAVKCHVQCWHCFNVPQRNIAMFVEFQLIEGWNEYGV